MLKIVVCIKQVPNTDKIEFDWKKGVLKRENVDNIINPDDLHAIELSLQLREKYGGEITVITMGPEIAEAVLWEAYAYGVDNCILLSDTKFSGSDTLITTKILNRCIKKLKFVDLVITGFKTLDGSTSQVSYQLAESLNIPHITQLHNVEIDGETAIIDRLFGHEYQKIKVDLPILIATNSETNSVRFMKLIDIKESFEKEILIWNMKDIGGKSEEYGLKGSPTVTIKGEFVSHKRKRTRFPGDVNDKVEKMLLKLKKYGML